MFKRIEDRGDVLDAIDASASGQRTKSSSSGAALRVLPSAVSSPGIGMIRMDYNISMTGPMVAGTSKSFLVGERSMAEENDRKGALRIGMTHQHIDRFIPRIILQLDVGDQEDFVRTSICILWTLSHEMAAKNDSDQATEELVSHGERAPAIRMASDLFAVLALSCENFGLFFNYYLFGRPLGGNFLDSWE
jgi:hypothetical protein